MTTLIPVIHWHSHNFVSVKSKVKINSKVQKRVLFCAFIDTTSLCEKGRHFPLTHPFREYENSRQLKVRWLRPKWKNTHLLWKKKGSVYSYSLDNIGTLSDRTVPSFHFISGKTKRDLGFCGLFCYLNSPVLTWKSRIAGNYHWITSCNSHASLVLIISNLLRVFVTGQTHAT